jgi:exodeoxyribonuclease VII large subunit
VSAIGHEGDRPLCDEVADLRCGTPSIAAAAVVPDRAALSGALDGRLAQVRVALEGGLERGRSRLGKIEPRRALGQGVERAAHRLDRLSDRLAGTHPDRRLLECQARLRAPDWRRPLWEQLGRAEGRLGADMRHLQALSPARTLERGYAVVTRAGGEVVRRASSLEAGEAIAIRLAAGSVGAVVTRVDGEDGGPDG